MTRRYTSLGCGADVRSSWEDCPPPRDNPPSVRQSARHAGTELRPGTFSPRETYDTGFSVSAQIFNFLGSSFPITTRDRVSTHLTLSDSCPFTTNWKSHAALAGRTANDLQLTTYDLRLPMTFDLRLTTYDLRLSGQLLSNYNSPIMTRD